MKHAQVAVVGCWHLAFVTAACLADTGHTTLLVNPRGSVGTSDWSEFPEMPVYETGVQEMLQRALTDGKLEFTNGIDESWSSDSVWLAVDTPVNEKDEPDVEPLMEIAQAIGARSRQPSSFIVSSQIPLGFHVELESILGPRIAYVPENLRLGAGIATFRDADRTVVGASSPAIADAVGELLKDFNTKILLCDLPTAEMVKHANNAFLATSISFANEMADIGSRFGVDSYFVARALKMDSRIGAKAYVSPGLGFAGGTLPRDLRVLEKLGVDNDFPTPLISSVLEVNKQTSRMVANQAQEAVGQGPRRVLIMGYTYKADTDTLRRSLSVEIAAQLRGRGVDCHGFDPFMNGKDLSGLDGTIQHHETLEDAPPCPVVLVLTARSQFQKMDWRLVKHPVGNLAPTVIDTVGVARGEAVTDAGLRYRLLWAPDLENRSEPVAIEP